jgi:uncharacterized protein
MLIALLAAIAVPPAPTHFVTDTAGMLSSSAQDAVEAELRGFESKTGDQVIVWIGDSTGDTPLEDWTVDAAEKWRVGRRGMDDGAVLFIFKKDRKVRIEVGYGLESSLTDARAAEIIRETIAPEMAAGTPDKAVHDGVDEMLRAIDADHAPPAPPKPFNLFAAIGHAIGMTMLWFKYLVGGAILLFVAFYFVFGELVTWFRRGKPHGDWMDSYMSPIHQDIEEGEKYGGSGGVAGHGGGGSGGGFSGGGGSFGGGGASGGW